MLKTTLTLGLTMGIAVAAMGNEPATKPADNDPQEVRVDIAGVDGVIKLGDGQTIDLANLPGGVMTRVAVVRGIGSDGTTTQINEDGREITIFQAEDGKIEVTIKEEGKDPVVVKAANAEELEKNHPEAFELYQRHNQPEFVFAFRDAAGGAAAGGGVFDGQRFIVRGGPGGPMGMARGGAPAQPIEALGASGAALRDPFMRSHIGEGVMIMRIDPDSFAQTLGLKQYDLIKSVNGDPVTSPGELDEALVASDRVSVEIIRGGKPMTLEEQ